MVKIKGVLVFKNYMRVAFEHPELIEIELFGEKQIINEFEIITLYFN